MRVVNKRKEKHTHYIGRGSIFGNPFKIGGANNYTREDVIVKYEQWLRMKLKSLVWLSPLGQAIYDLPESAVLGCFCKPKACHGDIIIKIWKELHNER